jgi:hypothetical protein
MPPLMMSPDPNPIVDEVLRFEDLPLGSAGSRRAIVRWSDGSESEAWCGTGMRSWSARATSSERRTKSSARSTSAETGIGFSPSVPEIRIRRGEQDGPPAYDESSVGLGLKHGDRFACLR